MADLRSYAVVERTDLLALLRSLTPAQWEAPTLCTAWSVREVAAHVLSYDDLGVGGLLLTLVQGGFRPDAANEAALDRFRDLTPAELVARWETHLEPRGLAGALGGSIALTDATIHHQDLRRALGLPRELPAERLVPVLQTAASAPTLPSRRNRKGVRLVATDVEWSAGTGPEVTGPGEALLMAMAGRRPALADLGGPGLATFREQVMR